MARKSLKLDDSFFKFLLPDRLKEIEGAGQPSD